MTNHWSIEEENLLADMWLEVSQYYYNDSSFWNEVVERFNNQSDGDFRNKNQITAKWARLTTECQKFNDIYLNLQRTSHDNDHIHNAMNIFKERFGGRGFKHIHVWFILRNNPIWNKCNA